MFRKIVDVLKEVFWIKPSRKTRKPSRRSSSRKSPVARKAVKKSTAKKKIPQKTLKPLPKPKVVKALKKPPKAVQQSKPTIDPSLVEVGVITHYFDRIKVSVVKLTQGTVLIGDKLTIQGDKTKFVQKVWSMQIESEDVKVAKKGQVIGIKVDKIVAVGDKIYK